MRCSAEGYAVLKRRPAAVPMPYYIKLAGHFIAKSLERMFRSAIHSFIHYIQ